jgi:serine/threonine protein kinase
VTPERWQEIKAVLAQALETPTAERDAFVDRAAGDDVELRREVLSLLAVTNGSDILNTGRAAADPDRALHALLATALGQQYEIVRPLGRGGMGAVYLARERALERFVAIKVLRPDLAAAADSRERFRREARVAAQLSHAGILPLHTFGEVSGIWYFVMGYVRGVSLAERLRIEGRIDSSEAHRILIELADALECAHRNGVIHRDIKPANVLLDEESGHAMLADFGISKVQGAGDSLTGTGVVIGTPHFMSPEQSLGAAVDERSDIYSLGAVGYMMLSGREPFADTPPEDLTLRRLSHEPVPLSVAAPTVPADLASIVMRCLARDPAARWPNARELRDVLARANGDSLSTLPESLRDLPTFGPYALIWAAMWSGIAFRVATTPSDRVLLLLIAVLVPVGFVFHIWNVGRHGLGASALGRVAFWPPDWWGMWWPRALRRPTDLWNRLPRMSRAVRVAVSAFLIVLPTMIVLRPQIEAAIGEGGQLQWFGLVESMLVVGVAAVTIAGLIWAYRLRLSWPDTIRLLFGATAMSPGWLESSVARWLSRAVGSSRPPARDTPADHRRAIVDLVQLLPPPTKAVGGAAADYARRLVAAVDACDDGLAALSRGAGPDEVERLTTRLAALESAGTPIDPQRAELATLVRRELDVVRQMRVRGEVIAQRRTRLFTLLRGLWTQLALLHDSATQDAVSGQRLVRRLEELYDEIEGDLAAHHGDDNSRRNQARAVAHSRLTVAGETSSASAVSSIPKPPK